MDSTWIIQSAGNPLETKPCFHLGHDSPIQLAADVNINILSNFKIYIPFQDIPYEDYPLMGLS
jgi:hypothetical protein